MDNAAVRIDKDLVRIISRISNEKKKAEKLLPAEYRKLSILLEGGPNNAYIHLSSGEKYYFDWGELTNLAHNIPWYATRFVELPFVFRYRRTSWYAFFELVNNVKWNSRVLGLLFENSLTREKKSLSTVEIKFMLKHYKSLMFIILDFSI